MTEPTREVETKTHRCIDCPVNVEHYQGELCKACGRCAHHCHHLHEQPKRRKDA